MRLVHKRRKKARHSFGFAAVLFSLMPTQIGYQDLASLLARQSDVAEHWRAHLIASPFGTIHAATFSFARPVGTAISVPVGFILASFDPGDADITGMIRARFMDGGDVDPPAPIVNRTLKGDRLKLRETEAIRPPIIEYGTEARASLPVDMDKFTLASANPIPEDIPATGVLPPVAISLPEAIDADKHFTWTDNAFFDTDVTDLDAVVPTLDDDVSPAIRTARVYFGIEPMGGGTFGTLEPWPSGQKPVFETPDTINPASKPADAKPDTKSSETIAGKGQVTGEGKHPKSPAERLGLAGKSRAKAEKCLADAVYFEARGESVRGQIAVAQVVMNRVFSGYYPGNVCGVVYQNAHRHLACQFTFACDGIPERVNEPDAWERAKRIASATLDGKFWLADVGKATHYHAYWVHPWWVRTMRKLDKIGVHTFYRPRKWGDGSDTPIWGDAQATKDATKKL